MSEVTLYRGDCLEFLRTLPDRSIDAVITDPPYGHGNNNGRDLISKREEALGIGKNGRPRPIANDGPEANDLFRASLREWNRLMRHGGCCCCCCCCCGGGGPDPQFARWSLWLDDVFDFKQMIVWDKGPIGMGWHYRRSYETVLVAQKRGGKCKWYDDSHRVENIIRPGAGVRKIIPRKNDHPTPKPVELAEHFLRLHTAVGDTVLDPFMGHGWVGIACMNLGRRFIGCEVDAKFFRAAKRRIAEARKAATA